LTAVKSIVALSSGFLVSWCFGTYHPLQIWRKLFPYRLAAAVITQGAVMLVFIYRDHHWCWLFGLVPAILSSALEMTMYVALVAFNVQIADPRYGGIYIPLISTTLDIRYDILGFVYTEIIGFLDKGEDLDLQPKLIDGYQIVNAVGVIIAIPVFYWFLIPATKLLQGIDREKWMVKDKGDQYIELGSGTNHAIPLED
jgi:PAT family acetyl-CoA transporter-like MFS transporter 1